MQMRSLQAQSDGKESKTEVGGPRWVLSGHSETSVFKHCEGIASRLRQQLAQQMGKRNIMLPRSKPA